MVNTPEAVPPDEERPEKSARHSRAVRDTNLRRTLKARDMSVKDLAEKLGLAVVHVRGIVAGSRKPSKKTRKRIEEVVKEHRGALWDEEGRARPYVNAHPKTMESLNRMVQASEADVEARVDAAMPRSTPLDELFGAASVEQPDD